jgi:hypothetical protein
MIEVECSSENSVFFFKIELGILISSKNPPRTPEKAT